MFADMTSSNVVEIPFTFNVPEAQRCIKVKKGTMVKFVPDGGFASHPLYPNSAPSPLTIVTTGADKTFTMTDSGIFYYICGLHSSMKGGIEVVN
jgi:plastocyanin